MTARVTQQLLLVGYKTSPQGRITAVAMEVVRPTVSGPVTNSGTQIIVVASS